MAGKRKMVKKKKGNEEDSSNNFVITNGGQEPTASLVQQVSINDLPAEMLTKILENVGTRTLLKCRLMSRQWRGVSTVILTKGRSLSLGFKHWPSQIMLQFRPGRGHDLEKLRLKNFVNLMEKPCGNCPYTHFSFDINSDIKSFFEDKDWIAFLSFFSKSNQNPNKLKGLTLYLSKVADEAAAQLLEEKLRYLFQNKMAHLEQFYFQINSSERITSFSNPNPNLNPVQFQLSNLKVFKIQERTFHLFPQLIQDILNAAVNLQVIDARSINQDFVIKMIPFLHSLEKLHLMKDVDLVLDETFLLAMKNLMDGTERPLLFKLTRFNLESTNFPAQNQSLQNFCTDASNFLSDLFESSKNSLRELKISPFGFLEELKLPKFKNLLTLHLLPQKDRGYFGEPFPVPFPHAYFPPGTGTGSTDIFPAVEFLYYWERNWLSAFPQDLDFLPIFPCKKLMIFNYSELWKNGNVIPKIARMFPNLQICRIFKDGRENFNFSHIGQEIWSHLTQLESLEVDIYVNSQQHAFPALDSCFTGISRKNCRRLDELMKAGKIQRNGSGGTLEFKIPEAEMIKLTQREHPSILDLKNLKTLIINPYTRATSRAKNDFFTHKLSWISEEFAFKFLPHLKPKPNPADAETSVQDVVPYSLRNRQRASN